MANQSKAILIIMIMILCIYNQINVSDNTSSIEYLTKRFQSLSLNIGSSSQQYNQQQSMRQRSRDNVRKKSIRHDDNWDVNPPLDIRPELYLNNDIQLINFTKSNKQQFFTVYRSEMNEFFIGSVNHVYRVDLIKDDDANDFKFVEYAKQLPQGPYKINKNCQPYYSNEFDVNTKETNNSIIQIFEYDSNIYVCGTNRCGLCTQVSKNFTNEKIYGTNVTNVYGECEIDFNKMTTPRMQLIGDYNKNRINTETDYDLYLKPINFITTSDGPHGSLIFFGKFDDKTTIYTAYSDDGRAENLQLPFITARELTANGFRYVRRKNPECSRIKLKSSNYQFKFVTGFNHDNYAYFLFNEEHFNQNYLRLGRLCENDPTSLNSYMESTLKCDNLSIAHTAHLSVSLVGNEYDGFDLDDENSSNNKTYLIIAFNDGPENGGKSIVCQYSMEQISQHFRQGFHLCQSGRGKSIEKLIDEYVCHENSKQIMNGCLHTSLNRYIQISKPLKGRKIFQIEKDHITTIGSIIVNNYQHLFFGTLRKYLCKLIKQMDHEMRTSYCLKVDSALMTMQNITFDYKTSTFYLLTANQLIRYPILSCSIYKTCSSCFTSIKIHNEECYWHQNKCVAKRSINDHYLPLKSCPPVVFSYEPKQGPLLGGSELVFYGQNFGDSKLSLHDSRNTDLRIQLNERNCTVIERNDTFARCRIDNYEEDGDYFEETDATIRFFAKDNYNYSLRKYHIEGEIELKDKFRFTTPVICGMHPTYGPFIGGTKILLIGRHLNIGTQTVISLGGLDCQVLLKHDHYIICETSKINVNNQSIHPKFKKLFFKIDNFQIKLNQHNPLELSFELIDKLLDDYDDDWNYRTCEEMRDNISSNKRNEHGNIRHRRHNHNKNRDYYYYNHNNLMYGKQFLMDPFTLIDKMRFHLFDNSNQNETIKFDTIFEYRQNPNQIINPKIGYGFINESSFIKFHGKHFDSIRYPELELLMNVRPSTFDNGENHDKHIITKCQINHEQSKSSFLSCMIPSLKWLNIDNEDYFNRNQFEYRLFLDNINDISGKIQFEYYEPKFLPLPSDEEQYMIISQNDRLIKLYGYHLSNIKNNDYPIRIQLNNTFDCKLQNSYDNHLECIVDIDDEQLINILHEPMNVSVTLGSNHTILGKMLFEPEMNKSKFLMPFLIIGFTSMITLLFACFCFIWFYVRQHLPDDKTNNNNEYNMISQMSMNELSPNETQRLLDEYFESIENGLEMREQLIRENKLIYDNSRLKILESLGSGNYGIVYKGQLDNDDSNYFAVKTIKNVSHTQLLLKEMNIMKDFNHPNVMSLKYVTIIKPLLGPYQMPSLALITPLMDHGDLRAYVANNANSPRICDLINYSRQIALGMDYLSQRNFVHRDLAARNCLMDKNFNVKISDFGLSRCYETDKNYYKVINNDTELPFRWMAIESLKENRFTTKSDVWSYGVLVWELYTRGMVPYGSLKNLKSLSDLVNYLEAGYRLEKPIMLDILWILNLKCWLPNPDERPTFREIVENLDEITRLFREKRADMSRIQQLQHQQSLLNTANTTMTLLPSTPPSQSISPSPIHASTQFLLDSQPFLTNDSHNASILFTNFNNNNMHNHLSSCYEKLRNNYQSKKQLSDNDLYQMCYTNHNLQINDYQHPHSQQQQQHSNSPTHQSIGVDDSDTSHLINGSPSIQAGSLITPEQSPNQQLYDPLFNKIFGIEENDENNDVNANNNNNNTSRIQSMMISNDGNQSPPPYLEATSLPPNSPFNFNSNQPSQSSFMNQFDYNVPRSQPSQTPAAAQRETLFSIKPPQIISNDHHQEQNQASIDDHNHMIIRSDSEHNKNNNIQMMFNQYSIDNNKSGTLAPTNRL